jgi:FkbM family methyltransferase
MMLDFNQLLEKYDIKIKGILHVGAHEGGETLVYVKAGIKNVLLVEANPFRFSNLTESLNTGRYCVWCSPLKYEYFNESESQILKGYKAYNYAVSNRDEGTITFNLSNYDGGTDSIFKINEWGRDSSWVPYEHIAEIEVPTITLDKLVENKDTYNFLNMDVEGAELIVLSGATKVLKHLDCIMLETQDKIRFEGSCTREQLIEFLKPHGFELKEYHDTGKEWGDCLFLKNK